MSNKLSKQRSLGRRISGVTMPISRRRMRWGRNWACLCGSDIKYKKCCLNDIEDLTSSDDNAVVEALPESVVDIVKADKKGLGIKNNGK